MTCLLLFYEFFKTGLFAVGGGLATLPFLYDMAARHPEWFTVSQLAPVRRPLRWWCAASAPREPPP